jgi:hypothetical protein
MKHQWFRDRLPNHAGNEDRIERGAIIVGWILAIFTVALFLILFSSSILFNDVARSRFEAFVHTESGGKYTLNIGSMKYRASNGTLTAAQITLRSQSLRQPIPQTSVDTVTITDINPWAILKLLFHSVAPWERVNVRQALTLLLHEHATIVVQRLRATSLDSLYTVSLPRVVGFLSEGTVIFDSASFRSNFDERAFSQRHAQQENRYDVTTTSLELYGLDIRRLIRQTDLAIRSIVIDKWKVDVYLDLRLPPDPTGHPLFPNEALRSVQFPLSVDTIRLTDGTVSYREHYPAYTDPATVTFEQITATVASVSNDTAKDPSNQPRTVLTATLALMGAGTSSVVVESPLYQRSFYMRSHGTVSRMDLSTFNRFLSRSEHVRITGGMLDSLWYSMDVRQSSANGELTVLYHNLAIEVDNLGGGVIKNTGDAVKTFVANALALKPHNSPTEGDTIRTASITYQRSGKESFFRFYWRTILGGLAHTVGFNAPGSD